MTIKKSGANRISILILILAAVFTFAAIFVLFDSGTGAAYAVSSEVQPFTVSVTPSGNNYSMTYGNPLVMNTAMSRALSEGETRTYTWYRLKDSEGNDIYDLMEDKTSYTLAINDVRQSGTYSCTVTVSNGSDSLSASASCTVTINPRNANVIWDTTTPLIYNGEPQMPAVSARGIGNTYITLVKEGAVIDAGTGYTASVFTLDPNYQLNVATVSTTFAILPKEIEVQWENLQFTYNGTAQCPEATATGVAGLNVPLNIAGATVNANKESGFTAVASTSDTNYTIKRSTATVVFYVYPLVVETQWGDTELVYNGQAQAPTASAEGIDGYAVPLSFYGTATNVSATAYQCYVTTSDGNYQLDETTSTVNFYILPRPVEVIWEVPGSFYYNRRNQSSSVVARYRGISDTQYPLLVSFENNLEFKNAGSYTAYAALPPTATNFTLEGVQNASIDLTIQKAVPVITVTDVNPVFTYTGEEYSVAAEISSNETIEYKLGSSAVSNTFSNPGIYDLTLSSFETQNYVKAQAVSVRLTILAISFSPYWNSDFEAALTLLAGQHPNMQSNVKEINEADMPTYNAQWARKILSAYVVTLTDGEEEENFNCGGTVEFKLPNAYASQLKVRIITLQDGVYREQLVDNKEGYVTFKLYESNVFAITEVEDDLVGIWWGVMAGFMLLVILSVTIHFIRKNRQIG